jgi:hypothetical protein
MRVELFAWKSFCNNAAAYPMIPHVTRWRLTSAAQEPITNAHLLELVLLFLVLRKQLTE